MITTTGIKAKIYLAEERGLNELPWFRSYNTFRFGQYNNPHKDPADNLYVLNDDTLGGGQSCSWLVEENSWLILLPVAGAIEYRDSRKQFTRLQAGQIQTVFIKAGTRFELVNPYEEELINYLQLWIRTPARAGGVIPQIGNFDLSKKANSLITVSDTVNEYNFRLHIGKYDGRRKDTISAANPGNTFFAFVIQGAFELQEILLHARDGLAVWQPEEIEFEALSNDAILLLLEMSNRENNPGN